MILNWNILESGVKYQNPKIWNDTWLKYFGNWCSIAKTLKSGMSLSWNILESVYCQIPKNLKSGMAITEIK